MQVRNKGPMLVILVIAAVVVFVVAVSTQTWRDRVNPSVVNQAPSVQQPEAANR